MYINPQPLLLSPTGFADFWIEIKPIDPPPEGSLRQEKRSYELLVTAPKEKGWDGQGTQEREQVEGTFSVPFEASEVEWALASAGRSTSQMLQRSLGPTFSTALDPMQDLGRRLFTALLEGRLQRLYQRSLKRAEQAGGYLRVRLILPAPQPSSPSNVDLDVVDLPWEYLFDPERQDFVALSKYSALVRCIGGVEETQAQTAPHITPPLRALFLTAGTPDSSPEVEQELNRLHGLEGVWDGRLEVMVESPTSEEEALNIVKRCEGIHLLHFAGMGSEGYFPGLSDPSSAQVLQFGGELRPDRRVVSVPRLRKVLAEQAQLRFVYFNACYSAKAAGTVASAVPAVLGIRGTIAAEARLAFTTQLYAALLQEKALEEAVTEARQSVDRWRPGLRLWGGPTLYVRSQDGFALQAPVAMPSQPSFQVEVAHAASPQTQREVQALQLRLTVHQRNLVNLERQRSTFEGMLPDRLQEQLMETQSSVNTLKAQLNRLQE